MALRRLAFATALLAAACGESSDAPATNLDALSTSTMGAVAALGYQVPVFGEIVGCSAVVLTPRIVVTAAHCTIFSESNYHLPLPLPPPVAIFLGLFGKIAEVGFGADPTPGPRRPVQKIIVHQGFDPLNLVDPDRPSNDIALLILSADVPPGVISARLPSGPLAPGARLHVPGFGVPQPGNVAASQIPPDSFEHTKTLTFATPSTDDSKLRLFGPSGATGSLCFGDSGAAMFSDDGTLRAIVSASKAAPNCSNTDLLATNLQHYADWIHDTAVGEGLTPPERD